MPSRIVLYAVQEPLKEELDRLQKQQISTPGHHKASQWCNNFELVAKAIGIIQLCLDLARLKNALIRAIHRGPALNVIILRLAGVKYFPLIDASSGYHNLRLDKRSSYLMFSGPVCNIDI